MGPMPERPEDSEIFDPWNTDRFSRLCDYGVSISFQDDNTDEFQPDSNDITTEDTTQ